MTDFNLWYCLPPETQKILLKAGWKAVKEKPIVKNLDTAMEDLEEISRLMKQAPKNILRDSRW